MLCFGGTNADSATARPLSKGYLRQFAVFPKNLLRFNSMEYVVWQWQTEDTNLFVEDENQAEGSYVITYAQHIKLMDYLKKKKNPALLPIQIAYCTGLRIGEACALTWQNIAPDNQCLTVWRSMRYNGKRHKTEIGTTKRKIIRTVDFFDTLAALLRKDKTE